MDRTNEASEHSGGSAGVPITIDGVSKTFVVGAEVTRALVEVSFDVSAGEFVSLIGPSGCGKTTLARMVGDLIAPSSGTITLDGRSPSELKAEQRIGFVFQAPTLVEWNTLVDNVALPLRFLKWPRPRREARARQLLELVGLEGFEGHYPDQVSGGMQQRTSIARALSFNPSLLIMDEPLGALDMITRDRMGFELQDIWQASGQTVLFITHSIEEAVLLSDKVVVMSPRPASVMEVVQVDLPRPRARHHRQDPHFVALTARLREMLEP